MEAIISVTVCDKISGSEAAAMLEQSKLPRGADNPDSGAAVVPRTPGSNALDYHEYDVL